VVGVKLPADFSVAHVTIANTPNPRQSVLRPGQDSRGAQQLCKQGINRGYSRYFVGELLWASA